MSVQDPGFFSYLYSDASRFMDLKMFGILCITAICILWLWVWFSRRIDARLEDAALLSAPRDVVVLHPWCEARAYTGRVELIRKGACVAKIESGVIGVKIGGTKEDRLISVFYPERTQTVCCGPAGWYDAEKAAGMIMHYAGGKQDG